MINWISTFLEALLKKLRAKNHKKEEKERREKIDNFFLLTLPVVDPFFVDQTFSKNGEWNYFILPSGKYPLFAFVYTQIHLFVYIAGPLTSNWASTASLGYSKKEWEDAQSDLSCIESYTSEIPTDDPNSKPKLMVIRWDDPVNPLSLYRKLRETLNIAPNS